MYIPKKISILGFPEIGMEKIEKEATESNAKCHYQSATQEPTESTIVTLFIASNVCQ